MSQRSVQQVNYSINYTDVWAVGKLQQIFYGADYKPKVAENEPLHGLHQVGS